MRNNLFNLTLLSLFLFPTSLLGSITAPLSDLPQDISTKFGIWSGKVSTSSKVDYDLSLGTVAVAFPKDLSTSWERQYQIEFWVNPDSKQVVKQNLEANWSYCLFGGTRRYRNVFKHAEVIKAHRSCLGFVYRMGISFYDIPPPEGAISALAGRSFEGSGGVRYSAQIAEKSDFGFSLTSAIFSVTASREQIVADGIGITLFFRGLI